MCEAAKDAKLAEMTVSTDLVPSNTKRLCNFSQHYDTQKAHKMADSFLVWLVQYSIVHRLTVPASARRNAAPTKQNPAQAQRTHC